MKMTYSDQILPVFLLLPLLGFLTSLFIPSHNENYLSRIATITSALNLILFIAFLSLWFCDGHSTISFKIGSIYEDPLFDFSICLHFDKIGAVFLLVGMLITFLIIIFCQYYLHRENGYKRFFNTILLFYFGYILTVLSGNFETLFTGWEILGISSFLLISFYRERYLPSRNAVKIFSVYRIGDIGILLTIWAGHQLWHENFTFLKLDDHSFIDEYLANHRGSFLFISLMLFITAAVKSAQFPFSSWLARAMEGPTPSSAIFYGSLSVHIGVFLLLRTYPLWEHLLSVRILIGIIGLVTSLVSVGISGVQYSIKTQIAYVSIAQIGIIFIEISFGLINVSLLHFVGNAFLRTYQLLISPSVITYLIREQMFTSKKDIKKEKDTLLRKIHCKLYLLNVQEWNLDQTVSAIIFTPLKKFGQQLNFLNRKNFVFYMLPVFAFCTYLYFVSEKVPNEIKNYLPYLFALIGLLLVLKSFAERNHPQLAWACVTFNHFWVTLAVAFNDPINIEHSSLYLSGIIIAAIPGFICLEKLRRKESEFFDLNQYYGHVFEYPKLSFLFLICCLGVMGFPITSSFIGEDLLYGHIRQDQFLLAFFISLAYIMGGISLIRIYARLFLGSHVKTYHETSIKTG